VPTSAYLTLNRLSEKEKIKIEPRVYVFRMYRNHTPTEQVDCRPSGETFEK